MPHPALDLPADETATAVLTTRGLRYGVLDPAGEAAASTWTRAVERGFHESEPTPERLAEVGADLPDQRTVAVWDDTLDDPAVPVATTTCWPATLALPGGGVSAWAISDVTVAPTHRRRGIARAVLEGELRTAVAAGLPLAALTVSEATIYRRFGFGPAAWAADLEVDTRRAGWLGGDPPGRVQLVDRDTALRDGRGLVVAAQRAAVGDVEASGSKLDRLFGSPARPDELRAWRFARYDDGDGVPRGITVYRVEEDPRDLTNHTAHVLLLAATTDDASAALWRFLLELDLVARVRIALRSTDEPLRWLVRDQRAITTTALRDHLWVRVLDPVALLTARTYGTAGRLGLRVDDPLGYADGSFVLDISAATPEVVREEPGEGVPVLDVPVDLLGGLALGGVSAVTLLRAGRIAERAEGDAAAADTLLRWPSAPVLTTWF